MQTTLAEISQTSRKLLDTQDRFTNDFKTLVITLAVNTEEGQIPFPDLPTLSTTTVSSVSVHHADLSVTSSKSTEYMT